MSKGDPRVAMCCEWGRGFDILRPADPKWQEFARLVGYNGRENIWVEPISKIYITGEPDAPYQYYEGEFCL